jgi:hypothetical protein
MDPIRIGLNKYSNFPMDMPPARVRGSIHPSLEETGEISLLARVIFRFSHFSPGNVLKMKPKKVGFLV